MFYNIGYTNTMVIYCHSTVIAKGDLFYNTEWQNYLEMAVNYRRKQAYNIGPRSLPERRTCEVRLSSVAWFRSAVFHTETFFFFTKQPSLSRSSNVQPFPSVRVPWQDLWVWHLANLPRKISNIRQFQYNNNYLNIASVYAATGACIIKLITAVIYRFP